MSTPTYQLRLDRPLNHEIERLFRSQANLARRVLKKPDDAAIHTARKALKRARAVLRLARGALARTRYDELDRTIRETGRLLAPVREAAVALLLADKLAAEKALKPSVSKVLRSHLESEHLAAWKILTAASTLRASLDTLRLQRDELPDLEAPALYPGLKQTYARGRERLTVALEQRQAEDLHAWRRQVKHLGYQVRLLAPAWPLLLRPSARLLDTLGEALGNDHDLAGLSRVAHAADLDEKQRRRVHKLVRRRRRALQGSIWALGTRIYAEDEGAFAGRLITYLLMAHSETRGQETPALDGLAFPRFLVTTPRTLS